MKRKLVSNEIEEIQKKHNQIFPETIELIRVIERMNLIDAYYRGAIDNNSGKMNVDSYLLKYENECQ